MDGLYGPVEAMDVGHSCHCDARRRESTFDHQGLDFRIFNSFWNADSHEGAGALILMFLHEKEVEEMLAYHGLPALSLSAIRRRGGDVHGNSKSGRALLDGLREGLQSCDYAVHRHRARGSILLETSKEVRCPMCWHVQSDCF